MGTPADAPPTVEASEIDTALSQWPEAWVFYAGAGGGSAGPAQHQGFILSAVPAAEWRAYGSPEAFLEAHPFPRTAASCAG
jgi:hypothetical protein